MSLPTQTIHDAPSAPGQHHPLHSGLAARIPEKVEFVAVWMQSTWDMGGEWKVEQSPGRAGGNAAGRAGKDQKRIGATGKNRAGLGWHRKAEAVKDSIKQDV